MPHIEGDLKCKKHNLGFDSMKEFGEHANLFSEKCPIYLRLKNRRDVQEMMKVLTHGTTIQTRLRRMVGI